ncbi:hypothetical protein FRC0104_02416 [Corynebacterium diphtheriae]|nr:hypothetical protein FRC0104_02416 [Corynebacterium diphtheriae]CAB0836615.1 hypothetical protein FRC0332_00639 [Corynebacterium diphtheriae]CAB0853748.1 hypothetical protein FRC0356_00682 [Corynebacterium diphtheriae]CAB0986923.1 hypothetical protein FRC0513_00711 [Corynebacterium diphtheriae]
MRRIELITCGVDQIEEAKAQHLHAAELLTTDIQ